MEKDAAQVLLVERLDELAQLRERRGVAVALKQEMVDKIITKEIKDRLARVDEKFQNRFKEIDDSMALLESKIRNGVVNLGFTVKSELLQAVWNSGKTTWDTKALEGYAIGGHPELLQFKKVGEPYVSIKEVK